VFQGPRSLHSSSSPHRASEPDWVTRDFLITGGHFVHIDYATRTVVKVIPETLHQILQLVASASLFIVCALMINMHSLVFMYLMFYEFNVAFNERLITTGNKCFMYI